MTETAPVAREVAPAATSIVGLVAAWVAATGSRVKLMTELALAEAKLAAISISLMVFLAMLAAAFILGAWGLLLAGVVLGLHQLQLPLWPILLVLGGLHVLIAAVAWQSAVYLSRNLEFPVTRRQLSESLEVADEMASTTAQS